MVVYVDNGFIVGWYCLLDDGYYGDGTKETAETLYHDYFEYP